MILGLNASKKAISVLAVQERGHLVK